VKPNAVAYLQDFEFRDSQNHPAVTEDAIFRLYSMTKPATGVVAMMLVANGELSLDDPISKFIPAFADMKAGVEVKAPVVGRFQQAHRSLDDGPGSLAKYTAI
jgi:CubicO group peptidase (beta-lactamase class C family)